MASSGVSSFSDNFSAEEIANMSNIGRVKNPTLTSELKHKIESKTIIEDTICAISTLTESERMALEKEFFSPKKQEYRIIKNSNFRDFSAEVSYYLNLGFKLHGKTFISKGVNKYGKVIDIEHYNQAVIFG